MPRFAANLAYLFTERPLIERFAAAAAAGFKAVELQLPYDHAPSAIKAELVRHGLTQLGINSPIGAREGDIELRRNNLEQGVDDPGIGAHQEGRRAQRDEGRAIRVGHGGSIQR